MPRPRYHFDPRVDAFVRERLPDIGTEICSTETGEVLHVVAPSYIRGVAAFYFGQRMADAIVNLPPDDADTDAV